MWEWDTILGFGKHKGVTLRNTPIEYIAWLAKQAVEWDNIKKELVLTPSKFATSNCIQAYEFLVSKHLCISCGQLVGALGIPSKDNTDWRYPQQHKECWKKSASENNASDSDDSWSLYKSSTPVKDLSRLRKNLTVTRVPPITKSMDKTTPIPDKEPGTRAHKHLL